MFKPMLSGKFDARTQRYPVLVSPKLDGIRCIVRDGVAYSRNMKPIPNRHVQTCLAGLNNLDGELICGEPVGGDVWNRSQSGVMSEDGQPDFTFHVFDYVPSSPGEPFSLRLEAAALWVDVHAHGASLPVELVPHALVQTADELDALEAHFVGLGYEGVMLRDPAGPYKFGRSTAREGYLLKLKRFDDAEAVVVGTVEQMHNGNAATRDELGRVKRSHARSGKTGNNVLGALVCTTNRDTSAPIITTFEIGTGFTAAQRADLWGSSPIGRVVKFKHQGLTPDGVPRFPVFLGFRSEGA